MATPVVYSDVTHGPSASSDVSHCAPAASHTTYGPPAASIYSPHYYKVPSDLIHRSPESKTFDGGGANLFMTSLIRFLTTSILSLTCSWLPHCQSHASFEGKVASTRPQYSTPVRRRPAAHHSSASCCQTADPQHEATASTTDSQPTILPQSSPVITRC